MGAASRHAHDRAGAARVLPLALACLLAGVFFALPGCVFSETITERIYDSDPSSVIDYNLDPILVNKADAMETSDLLPKLEEDDSDREEDDEEDLPVLDEEEPSVDEPAPMPHFNPNAASNGLASDAPTSTEGTEAAEVGAQPGEAGAESGEGGDAQGEAEAPEVPEDDDDDEEIESDEDDGASSSSSSLSKGKKKGGSGDYYSDVPDMEDPEIPEGIDEVAAFGNNAVIVSILSGSASSTSLVACDADTKSKTASLLANRGIANVQAIDYTEGEAMPKAAFDALVKMKSDGDGLDLIYVTEGDEVFSEAQKKQLASVEIDVYTLPELTTDTRIRFTFRVIAETLDAGGVSGVLERRQAYEDICNDLVDTGNLAGDFDFDREKDIDGGDMKVSLLIDGWDDGARYNNSKSGKALTGSASGAAVATLGYSRSPVSYYLSAGGVLNNAASSKVRKQVTVGKGLVWQFFKQLSGAPSNWKSLARTYVDLSVIGGLFGESLLCYQTDYYGLGTDTFPAVIAASKDISKKMKDAAKEEGGLYYAYGTIKPSSGAATIGYIPNNATGGFYVESCIGRGTTATSVVGEGAAYDVYTNPKGLSQKDSEDALCSWTAGSPESVLEASWARWKFWEGGDDDAVGTSQFFSDVKGFYSTCYGYDLSLEEFEKSVLPGATV